MKVTSAHIKAALHKPFPAPGWRIFYEVGDDTGARVRRHADAVAMGIWPSNGHQIHGFEIKVSRADFAAEMRDPTKSQAVFQYCDRWSLVVPSGLVKAEEVPAPWGLMTFDGKSIRTVKQAPPLEPVPLTRGFIAAMLRRAGEADEAMISAIVEKAKDVTRKESAARLETMVNRNDSVNRATFDRMKEELDEYRKIFGRMNIWEIRRMAPALKALQTLGDSEAHTAVRRVEKALASAHSEVVAALSAFDKPDPDDPMGVLKGL